MQNHKTEIAIVGGGICGLWILNLLRDRGYDACLLERNQLGGAQTLASQGMIHGGIKYTLGGFTTPASETIASMPATWRACIEGKGALDLTDLPILSDDYYLFSDGALSSKITSFFASKSLRGRINTVEKDDRPAAFSNKAFRGNLYKLQDMVIDTHALVERLFTRHRNHVYQVGASLTYFDDEPILTLDDGSTLLAKKYIFAAGEGNGDLIGALNQRHDSNLSEVTELAQTVSMQTRPLKQVMLKGDLPNMFAHAVSLKDANKPRLTITTHSMPDGENVWYLGGNLAEQGVHMSNDEVIEKAKSELNALFPWINTTQMPFRTLDINRAEPTQQSGSRPDFPFVKMIDDMIVCWPTKLTLTPLLGDEVLDLLSAPDASTSPAPQLPLARVSKSPWELAFV